MPSSEDETQARRPREGRDLDRSPYYRAVHARIRSFTYAFAGIRYILREPNFRIQLTIGIIALVVAGLLRVEPAEWVALILVSLAVLVMEMLNTVVEALVDLTSPQYSPMARAAKDVAAGAVLVAAFASVVVGAYVFLPRLAHLVGWS